MGKLYLLISALLLAVSATFAVAPDSYEWWFDDDVSNVQSGSLSGGQIDLQIDTSDLPKGIHYFNLRLAEGDSIYGSVYRRIFHSFGSDNGAISYEYWYDNNYDYKTIGSYNVGTNHIDLDISSLPQGVHYFNCRIGYEDRTWGSVYRKMLLTIERSVEAVAFEYWIDEDYEHKTDGVLTTGVNAYDIALEDLEIGLHRVNYRVQNSEGLWGTPFSKYFYYAGNQSIFTEYEYWLDNDFESRVSAKTLFNPVSFDVDLSDFDKSFGVHYFNLRVRQGVGKWGSIYSKRLVFNEETSPRIIGYRHFINGIDLGYVEIDHAQGNPFSFEASLPDRSEIFGDLETSADSAARNDSISYVIQLKAETGWIAPVSWNLVLGKLTNPSVRFSYNGRYLMMESEDKTAEIHYALLGRCPVEDSIYSEPIDVEGLATAKAWAVRSGYSYSEMTELAITHYADEDHAATSEEGLLASAFEWDETGLHNNAESFRIEGRLNDADYAFIRSMKALRHLDIEKATDAHLPDKAFSNTGLISVNLPQDISEYGDGIFSEAALLSSVVWNSSTPVSEGLTRSLANPNALLYVSGTTEVANADGINIVRDGIASAVKLRYGFPYYAARDFRADAVSITHEFQQTTIPDICRGWETIVLPFSPTSITHESKGPIVPFAAWNEDLEGYKPFWLYSATSSGWEESLGIEVGLPYIISMPNYHDYVEDFNLGGKVTFSAEAVDLGPESSIAMSNPWVDGTRLEGTFMPVDDPSLHSLNIYSTEGGLQPGSKFVPGGVTPAFGAYVSGGPRGKAMNLFGSPNNIPTITDTSLLIETPAPGVLRICSGRERKVTVTTVTGVTVRTLHLKPGESVTIEGLTRDLYLVAGRKVMVR